jgi:hypothetical protein
VSPVRRRGLSAAALAVTAGLTLGACGTSFGAQTNQVYQPAVGANARGDVDSHNTQLVGNSDGSATLSAALVNNLDDDQTLTSIKVGSAATSAYVVTEGADPGDNVMVTYTFSDSGPLTVTSPVVARADHAAEYEDVAGGDGLVPSAVSGGESE